jgi:23S rRNA (adenine2503-C2)-methyltransferase
MVAQHSAETVSAIFRPVVLSGYATGALDIRVSGRRILSVPTQLGCRVGCTFCVSSTTPVIRNLKAAEMLECIGACLQAQPPDGRPMELSFTGEGEALLNLRETTLVCTALPALSADFSSVRYCFSGLGASRLLGRVSATPYVPRLQFSLHAARQTVRNALVPRSEPLCLIEQALGQVENRFASVELNVVLHDGINDSEADLDALARWGRPEWPILLNPLMTNGLEKPGARVEYFAANLRARGRVVHVYREVGARIARSGIYPVLTARKLP